MDYAGKTMFLSNDIKIKHALDLIERKGGHQP